MKRVFHTISSVAKKAFLVFFLLNFVFSPTFNNILLSSNLSAPLAASVVEAAFNQQINYQGKLMNALNVSVANGSYNIEFKLYTSLTGGSPIWTETWCKGVSCSGTGDDNRIPVVSGLFSTMLGSTTALTNVDFNQPLYLSINIGGSSDTPSWDGEMSPRKILGAVPAAFEAKRLNGLNDTQFVRTDTNNATSTASTFITLTQSGAGNILNLVGQNSASVFTALSSGNVGIGTTSPGQKLSVAGDILGNNIIGSYFTATSSSATSTFAGGITGPNSFTVQTSSGYVGIGTASPSAKLHVTGLRSNNTARVLVTDETGAIARLNADGYNNGTDAAANLFLSGDGDQQIKMVSGGQASTITAGPTGLSISGAGTSYGLSLVGAANTFTGTLTVNSSGSSGYVPLTITTSDSQATNVISIGKSSSAGSYLLMNSSGNLGIGTTSPGQKLSVAGDILGNNIIGSYFTGTSTTASTLAGALTSSGVVTGSALVASSASATSTLAGGLAIETSGFVYDYSTNNVGIGTASPGFKLDVQTSENSASRINIRNSSANPGAYSIYNLGNDAGEGLAGLVLNSSTNVAYGGASSLNLVNVAQAPLTLSTNNTVRMTVSSTGNVGIGTTSPWRALSVNGSSDLGNNALAGYFTATTSTASVFPYASTTAISVSGASYFTGLSTFANLLATGSSTLQNFTFVNATGTSATTTNFFATTASSTNLFASNLAVGGTVLTTSGGNVGIGTASPSTKLEVNGTFRVGNTTDTYMTYDSSADNLTFRKGSYNISFGYDDSDSFAPTINTSGATGVLTINASSTILKTGATANLVNTLKLENTGGTIGSTATAINFRAGGNVGKGIIGYTNQSVWGVGDLFLGVNGVADNTVASASDAKLTIQGSSGNVGIGTTSPGQKLSVAGDILGNNIIGSYFTGTSTTASTLAGALTSSGTVTGSALVASSASATSTLAGGLAIETSGFVYDYSTNNVGIGTASPLKKLHIATGNSNGLMMSFDGSSYRNSIENSFAGGSAVDNLLTFNVSNGTATGQVTALTLKGNNSALFGGDVTSGYVSMGTTAGSSSGNWVNLGSNSTAGLLLGSNLYDDAGQLKISLTHSNMAGAGIKIPGNGETRQGNIEFWTTPTGSVTAGSNFAQSSPRLVIDTSGNVGIGTTSPGQKLSVAGDILGNNIIGSYFTGTSTAASTLAGALTSSGTVTGSALVASSASATSTLAGGLAIETSGFVYDYSTNNVGIGTASPGVKMDVVGAIRSTNASNPYLQLDKTNATAVTTYLQIEGGLNNFQIYHNGSSRLDVTSAGLIGIGSTTPATTLSVAGSGYFTGGLGLGKVNTTAGTIDVSATGGYYYNGIDIGVKASSTNLGFFVGPSAGSTINTTMSGLYNTGFGRNAMQNNTTGAYNTAVGYYALQANTTGGGFNAGNTALGTYTLSSNTTGSLNTGLGSRALLANTTGDYNTGVGTNALASITGADADYNTAVGQGAFGNGNGSNNAVLGASAMSSIGNATNTVAIGYSAGSGNGSYSYTDNVFIGASSGYQTFGSYNTFVGSNTTQGQSRTGSYNILLGYGANTVNAGDSYYMNIGNILYGTSTTNAAINQIGIGTTTPSARFAISGIGATTGRAFAISSNTNLERFTVLDSGLVGIGTTSPATTLSVAGSAYITTGLGVGKLNTTANTIDVAAGGSYKINSHAMLQASTTLQNYYFGYMTAGNSSMTGTKNLVFSASGGTAFVSNTTGSNNIAFSNHWAPMPSNTTGNSNISMGDLSMYLNTTGSSNTAIGYYTLGGNVDGAGNVAVGPYALNVATTSDYSVAVGYGAQSAMGGYENIALGRYAMTGVSVSASTGYGNFAVGGQTLKGLTTGVANIAIGTDYGVNNYPTAASITTGSHNIIFGKTAGINIATSSYNIIQGYDAASPLYGGDGNVMIGAFAGRGGADLNWGHYNTFLGYSTGSSNASQSYSTAIGYGSAVGCANCMALGATGTGNGAVNVGIGSSTPYAKLSITQIGTGGAPAFVVEDSASPDTTPFIIDQTGSVGIGTTSPATTLSVAGSTYITTGLGVGKVNTTANKIDVASLSSDYGAYRINGVNIAIASTTTSNYFFGGNAGNSTTINTTMIGTLNTGVGASALNALTTGTSNTAVGYSQAVVTTGGYNASLGAQALRDTTIGSYNTVLGSNALIIATSTDYNTAIGYLAMGNAQYSGSRNIAIGPGTLYSNTLGNDNLAIGGTLNSAAALTSNTTGSGNVAVGGSASALGFAYGALRTNTTGSLNTALGVAALAYSTTGSNNTVIGAGAGSTIGTGSNNTLLGYGADTVLANDSYYMNLGGIIFATSTNYTNTTNNFVGIGTSSPSARFAVKGTSTGTGRAFTVANSSNVDKFTVLDDGSTKIVGDVTLTSGNITSVAGMNITMGTNSNMTFNGNSAVIMNLVGASGKVGIGTTSPYAALSVVGSTGVVAQMYTATSTTATSTFAGGLDVGSGALTYDFSSGITSISNLALGAMSFDTNAGAVSWADMPVTSDAAAGTAESYSAQVDGTTILTVYAESDGAGAIQYPRVGINKSNPAFGLDVVGTVGFTSGLNAVLTGGSALCIDGATGTNTGEVYDAGGDTCSVSSARFKHDIETLGATSGLSLVRQLRPVSFSLNSNNESRIGFIAEEVTLLEPRLVFNEVGSTTPRGVRYQEMTAILAKAIQELATTTSFISNNYASTTALLAVTADGKIGIGTTSPLYSLHVVGDVGATSFVNISTREAKRDISYLNATDSAQILEKLKGMKVATYHYLNEASVNPLRLGFIAEEAPAEVLSATGKGVDVYKLATFILAGVQTQQVKIESLEARVARLEAVGVGGGNGGVSVATVISSLEQLGSTFSSALAQFKKVVAESFTVGTAEKPSGITLYDEVTKAPYCLKMVNGVMTSAAGVCTNVSDAPATSEPASAPAPEPAAPAEGGTAPSSADTQAPTITVNGNNPATIEKNASYLDLGATVSDDVSQNIGYQTTGDQIDTSVPGTYTVTYTATDVAGNTATATRTVVVTDPTVPVTPAPVEPAPAEVEPAPVEEPVAPVVSGN